MHNIQSPRTDDDAIEQMIKAKGLSAPCVTLEDMSANIIDVEIVKHVALGGQVLRWAVLTTKSGFAVTGNPSVSVSPENDDVEIGVVVAIANAKNALWPLMGYALKEQLQRCKNQLLDAATLSSVPGGLSGFGLAVPRKDGEPDARQIHDNRFI